MARYDTGFILTRCFIQKRLEIRPGLWLVPLTPTGSAGELRDTAKKLIESGFDFGDADLTNTLRQFAETGQSVLVTFPPTEAPTYQEAIDLTERLLDPVIGSLAMVSANPVVPLCGFATGLLDSGVKFFVPKDRRIRHATNVAGFIHAVSDLEKASRSDPKLALLLRLYRASLRESEIDNQILFQLILLEEASDQENGTFAERLRQYAQRTGFAGDLNVIADHCGLQLPPNRDFIDVLVKLRNTAAHSGTIDAHGLRTYGGEWVIPLLDNKSQLHRAIGEAIRYMFCCLVGHTRDAKATRVTFSTDQPFTLEFG